MSSWGRCKGVVGSRRLGSILMFLAAFSRTASGQIPAASTYGSFTVGGSSSSYYPVQFTNSIYGAYNVNTSDIVIFRPNAHENGTWYGTFNLVISFHPTNWGHMFDPFERLIYETGRGSPYNDPVGDLADGSSSSGGSDLIVWLKGGATYYWRNKDATAGWSLTNGNSAGGSITDSSGITRSVITSQSSLVISSKNNFFVNALSLGTQNMLFAGGSPNPSTTMQGAYIGWNALTGGTGETDLINNQGGGSGGFAFMNTPPAGSPRSTLMFLSGAGSLGIGTTSPGAKLEVNGNVKLTAASGASITFADGTVQSTAYTGVTCGGDYAESMEVSRSRGDFEPGDVLELDQTNPGKVVKSHAPYSRAVAGVFSTRPGFVGRRQLSPKGEMETPMAMIGVVPTKVTAENGAIAIGDLLVSSSIPGYAMKGSDWNRMLGAVIGKAMGALESGTGVIEVLVTLQ